MNDNHQQDRCRSRFWSFWLQYVHTCSFSISEWTISHFVANHTNIPFCYCNVWITLNNKIISSYAFRNKIKQRFSVQQRFQPQFVASLKMYVIWIKTKKCVLYFTAQSLYEKKIRRVRLFSFPYINIQYCFKSPIIFLYLYHNLATYTLQVREKREEIFSDVLWRIRSGNILTVCVSFSQEVVKCAKPKRQLHILVKTFAQVIYQTK